MSGIAGLFGGADEASLRRLARPLDARGPAARWEGLLGGAGFVVVRSGLADDGPAVAVVEDRLVAVAGHVLNLPALARELGLEGAPAVAEVFGALVQLVGPARAAERLRGCVSVAVWDPERREAFLQRDPSGLRPLELAATPAGVAFASDGRVLSLAGYAGSLDAAALGALVRDGAPAGGRSVWRGAERLPRGGTWLRTGGAPPARTAPSAPSAHPAGASGNAERWLRSVRYGLELAAAGRVRAAGPTAIALSGGLASAALLACRTTAAAPEVALVLDDGEAAAAQARAAAAGLRVRRVPCGRAAFAELLDELPATPAMLAPEAWLWAALARAAWVEGATGLLAGLGVGVAFDPEPRGARAWVGRALGRGGVGAWAAPASGAPIPGDAPVSPLSPLDTLTEFTLAAFDGGAAPFGVAPIAPFADPAVIDVAHQVPVGVHHGGGRRALLAKIACAGGVNAAPTAPSPPQLSLREWLDELDPMGLPDRLAARLDPAHVRAVVAAASGGDPAALRRAFAYGVLARFG